MLTGDHHCQPLSLYREKIPLYLNRIDQLPSRLSNHLLHNPFLSEWHHLQVALQGFKL